MRQTNIPGCFLLLAVTALLMLFGSEARADIIAPSDPCAGVVVGPSSPW